MKKSIEPIFICSDEERYIYPEETIAKTNKFHEIANSKSPFKIFGKVVEFLNDHWPPMLQERPLFSITRSVTRTDEAPDAAVSESPSAAITSISPVPCQNQMAVAIN